MQFSLIPPETRFSFEAVTPCGPYITLTLKEMAHSHKEEEKTVSAKKKFSMELRTEGDTLPPGSSVSHLTAAAAHNENTKLCFLLQKLLCTFPFQSTDRCNYTCK